MQIGGEQDYRNALSELSQAKRPPAFLRKLMNLLESYRQYRKLGWSRPQNKYGMTVFRSFALDMELDRPLLRQVASTFAEAWPDAASRAFVAELAEDPRALAFFFFHDHKDEGRNFEGVTISLGRIVPSAPRHRDRFDLILESEILDGRAAGISRVRVFIDPFERPLTPCVALETEETASFEALWRFAGGAFETWEAEGSRAWLHWTQRYIDYFGPRTLEVTSSHFEPRSGHVSPPVYAETR